MDIENTTEVEETEVEETEVEDTGGSEDPAAVTAERDKLRATLIKVKAERAKLRRDLAASKGAPEQEPPAAAPQTDKLARIAGISALVSEGISKDQAKFLVRLLDLSGVEVDDEGDADLDEQITLLRTTLPALFAQGKTGSTVKRLSGSDRSGGKAPGDGVNSDASLRMLRAAGYR